MAITAIGMVLANQSVALSLTTKLISRRFVMNKFLVRLSLATALTLALVALGSPANAQDQPSSQEPAATTPPQQQEPAAAPQDQGTTATPQQQEPNSQSEMQTQDAKSFTGQVVKENGKVVLKDPVTKMSYKLDDQEKVAAFVGKQVKITGKLDMDTNTIHVDNIELLS